MTQEPQPVGAVFLSYASEDAEAASRLCGILRSAGIEVWFDLSELRGGDAWDSKIRQKIQECTLFMPLISAHTDARTEGYFRREWKLATRRMLDIADDATFLVPVAIDSTPQSRARVPEEFLGVHWTRLPGGEAPPEFVARLRHLLGGGGAASHAVPPPIAPRAEPVAGRGPSVRSWRIGIGLPALVLVLGGALYWRYQDVGETPAVAPTKAAAPESVSTPRDDRPSIAVLPLDNRSRQEDDAFFVDGIHDDILTKLSRVSGLKVISRTSVERFRGSDLGMKEIAAQLGVTSILEGGVQRAGNRVRINVQLIDARTDTHVWGDIYDRELTATNIFDIQSEVAASIVEALDAALTPDEAARASTIPTRSLEAWEAYQLGRHRMARRNTGEIAEAEKLFRKAIELDPEFVLAYAGLADSLSFQVSYAGAPYLETLEQAQALAETAVKLGPNSSEAWTSLAGIVDLVDDYDRAEPMYRRALELNPNNAQALQWLGQLQNNMLRFGESQRSLQRAASLDPLSTTIRFHLGMAFEDQGRFEEAAKEYRRAIEIDPEAPSPHRYLGELSAYALNRFADAAPLLQKSAALDSGGTQSAASLARFHLDFGNDSEAFSMIEEGARRWPGEYLFQLLSAQVARFRLDDAGARRHGERALALKLRNPEALAMLRDLELQSGRYGDAVARYRKSYPELFEAALPSLILVNYAAAVDLALVLQKRGETARSKVLLDSAWQAISKLQRMGFDGYGVRDAQIHTLRGDKAKALKALREAADAGWRYNWRYARDLDPALAPIRNEPEFKAAFADIERDTARQRAELAGRRESASN